MSIYYINDIKLESSDIKDLTCPHGMHCSITSMTCDGCEYHIRHEYKKRIFKIWCKLSASKIPDELYPAIM